MKFYIGFLFIAFALYTVNAIPARLPSDDAEVINVPRGPIRSGSRVDDTETDPDYKNFEGVIETGAGYPFFQTRPIPFSFNFGFFDSFEDILRRFSSRLWPYQNGSASGSDEESDTGFPFNFDPKKANSTSTVKVVDGHKIVVNDTTYGDQNSIFKVRIVNIEPVDSTETNNDSDEPKAIDSKPINNSPATTAPVKSNPKREDSSEERREPLEHNPNENEIGNGPEKF